MKTIIYFLVVCFFLTTKTIMEQVDFKRFLSFSLIYSLFLANSEYLNFVFVLECIDDPFFQNDPKVCNFQILHCFPLGVIAILNPIYLYVFIRITCFFKNDVSMDKVSPGLCQNVDSRLFSSRQM